LIYVFATHVNRSETWEIYREIDWFTASCKRVDVQKLSRAFAVCMCMTYMSCNACAKTLLSLTYVNWSENWNRLIYCVAQMCMCAKAESCLRSICVYVVCKLQHVRKDVAVFLCICKLQRVDDRVVIVSLFDCVWAQRVSKALFLLCWCWWDCSALLTSIACRRFVVSISYR